MVGITSVLLIAFFQQRPAPVENGLRVFAVYRACDIGLLVAVFAMHHWAGTASFAVGLPGLTGTQPVIVSLLLLLAAAGKAAQVPFSGWLPRAMEGPTPSSAIFYGAISIHAGAYLLLRIQPMIAQSGLASALVIVTGVINWVLLFCFIWWVRRATVASTHRAQAPALRARARVQAPLVQLPESVDLARGGE